MKRTKAAAAPTEAAGASPGADPAAPPAALPLSPFPGGCRLLLRAQPRAGRDEIAGLREGRLLVRVTAAPEDGKANSAIIRLLSKALGIPASSMEISSGQSSRDKTLSIHGYGPEEIVLPQ